MMTARWYAVTSPEWGEVVPILDDGSGPMEYGEDFLYVRARTMRRAKVLAVRAWRRAGSKYLEPGENPFTGVTVECLTPDYCKTVWGNLRYCVQPIAGSGSAWVNADSLTFTDEESPT